MEVYVPEETTGCRYHVWRLVTSPPFENFIMLLIVLNTLLLMMKVGCTAQGKVLPREKFYPEKKSTPEKVYPGKNPQF